MEEKEPLNPIPAASDQPVDDVLESDLHATLSPILPEAPPPEPAQPAKPATPDFEISRARHSIRREKDVWLRSSDRVMPCPTAAYLETCMRSERPEVDLMGGNDFARWL